MSAVLRCSANRRRKVIDGTETITRTSMDSILVGIASQDDGGRARPHRQDP
jgi:hypothetical protein